MPEWYKGAIQTLIDLYKKEPSLFTEIQLAVKRITRNPIEGDYIKGTYRVYIDSEKRFRIGYNYHPDAKEIEIVVIHIQR